MTQITDLCSLACGPVFFSHVVPALVNCVCSKILLSLSFASTPYSNVSWKSPGYLNILDSSDCSFRIEEGKICQLKSVLSLFI